MTEPRTLTIDIWSDVMCPWCLVGWGNLRQALDSLEGEIAANLRWHAFELNPDMGPEGENLRDHVKRKYGSSAADSAAARDRITAIGKEIGFDFAFAEDQRMWNTFRAHQLIDWAEGQGRAHDMKLALLTAYFAQGRNVDDLDVLVDVAEGIGLDADQARQALDSGSQADQVRGKQRFWTQQGITGVPAMVVENKFMIPGAQPAEAYADALRRVAEKTAA